VLKKRSSLARKKIATLLAKDAKAHSQLSEGFAGFKASKDLSAFKSVQQRVFTILESVQESLISSEFGFDAEFSKKLKTLSELLKQKSDFVKKEHEAVAEFFESGDSDENKSKLTKAMETLGSSLSSVEGKIKSIIKKL
jgi:hypothetical protein